MSSLLDVNVLLALAWPNHVHHAASRTWFASSHEAMRA
jgi:predicted nucleic acid-binding protein